MKKMAIASIVIVLLVSVWIVHTRSDKKVVSSTMPGELPIKEHLQPQQPEQSLRFLESFEKEQVPPYIKGNSADLKLVQEGAVDGKNALHIDFKPAKFSSVWFEPEKPWNWGADAAIYFEVTNPTDQDITFSVRVDDNKGADGSINSRTGKELILAGKKMTYALRLDADFMDYGMNALPPHMLAGDSNPQVFGKKLDTSNITKFSIFVSDPPNIQTLILDHIHVKSAPLPDSSAMAGIIDAFGQYTKADWPGKAKSVDDLLRQRKMEDDGLKAAPGMDDRSRFGGWAAGPKLAETGYFRTEQVDGRWWLVDPEGYLFLSTGVTSVRTSDQRTMIEGRPYMFDSLPADNGPLAKHYLKVANLHKGPIKSGKTFNFFTANLERKYGADYMNAWMDQSVRRFKSWGFTSLGSWPEDAFLGAGEKNKFAYSAYGQIKGNHARISSANDIWGPPHDPYDPRFVSNVRLMAGELAGKIKNDPWLVGIFVDNEQSWGKTDNFETHYALIFNALAFEAAASPAKRAFLEELQNQYGTIDKLNKAWSSSFKSWADMEKPVRLKGPHSEQLKGDFSMLLYKLAAQYYSTVRAELKKALPNHLYLGDRVAAWGRNPEIVKAAAEYTDVISFNVYRTEVSDSEFGYLQQVNRPVIIGEFHFAAQDRGMFGSGQLKAADQHDKGMKYVHYMNSVLANPHFVGAHWFQYTDQPTTGRAWDGENNNIGFVSITDAPHTEFIEVVRQFQSRLYEQASNGHKR
jgi:hypothetical protein